ncbi:hypothetical protein [Anoxynatronum sibiricum]|uniref:Response regulator n=1 Tax=Anoxynatronum sibiricum TaxID=210623 RepID=A0ABU9VTJ4_9CLOT
MDQSFKIAVCDDDQMIRHQLEQAMSLFDVRPMHFLIKPAKDAKIKIGG